VPDIATIVQIVLIILGAAVPGFLFSRLTRGDDSPSLANIFRAPDYNAWPRGVQEEEPFRWGMGQGVRTVDDADSAAEAGSGAGRTAPRQLRPTGSASFDDPIAEVA
jgi:hypothetical protein